MIKNLSNSELVLHVDNKPSATELERELADRLDKAQQELVQLQATLHNFEDDYK